MKIEKEIRAWVDDFIDNSEKASDLTGALIHVFEKYKPAKMRRRFAWGVITGILTAVLVLKWVK